MFQNFSQNKQGQTRILQKRGKDSTLTTTIQHSTGSSRQGNEAEEKGGKSHTDKKGRNKTPYFQIT